MADKTGIEWTDATWNPVRGCSRVSEGCRNCYAEGVAARFSGDGQPYAGLAKRVTRPDGQSEARWTGGLSFGHNLDQPLRWRKPRRIFVNSMSDLFHEDLGESEIDQVFAIMEKARHHTFQVLTKRPRRMRDYMSARYELPEHIVQFYRDDHGNGPDRAWQPPPNIWLGVSCENQATADERVPDLLETPAVVRFVSAEPLLRGLDLTRWLAEIDWVIAGGESGPKARPMHPDWVRSLRDQCAAAGTAFFFKQWGEWQVALDREESDPDWRADYSRKYADHGQTRWLNLEGGCGFHGKRFHVMRRVGKKAAGRRLDGLTHEAMPNVIGRGA